MWMNKLHELCDLDFNGGQAFGRKFVLNVADQQNSLPQSWY